MTYLRRMHIICGALPALLAVLCCASVSHAAARSGPGRVAITGAYPTGYIGLLARYGMPRDILLDYQLADADLVARYDLLIVAGPVNMSAERVSASLERLFARGGTLLMDYSGLYQQQNLRDWLNGRRSTAALPGIPAPLTRTTAPFRVAAGQGNPLRADFGDEVFPTSRLAMVVDTSKLGKYQVLAEYTSAYTPGTRIRPGERRRGFGLFGGQGLAGAPFPGATAPPVFPGATTEPVFPGTTVQAGFPGAAAAAPSLAAIVLEQRGAGRILHCGPALAYATSLAGMDFDRLILGLVRVATDGRAVPQLEPEGPRLARRQSPRSVTKQEPGRGSAQSGIPDTSMPAASEPAATPMPAEVPEVPQRPAGPGAPGKLPAGYTAIESDPEPEYNVSGVLRTAEGVVTLNYWNSSNCLRVAIGQSGIRIVRVSGGKATPLGYGQGRVAPGTPFIIKERSSRLSVIAGTVVASAALTGVSRGQVAAQTAMGSLRYQPVEAVCFSDDFMRTSDEDGGWTTEGGAWKTAPLQNPDMGANPFSYKVEAKGPAIAIAGYPFWDEYRYGVSARLDALQGAIGLGFYARDPENMLLFQARSRDGERANDGFSLVRLKGGAREVLAQCAGGLSHTQWYRLQVQVQGPWIAAFVDGVKVLTARDTTFTGGKVALRAEGTLARFDDVVVEPSSTPTASGRRLVAHVPPYAGVIDVDSWAGPATPWDPDPETPGMLWRRGIFRGDVGLRFDLPKLPDGARAMLVLDGDGVSADSGYAVALSRTGATGRLELLRKGQVVAQEAVSVAKELILSLRREGDRITALVDNRPVATATATNEQGVGRIAFQALGFRPRVSTVAVWSGNVRDYTFDAAPVEWWVGGGEWDVTNRWSCTPDWSWFGGYSRDVAAIWHKQAFEGDTVLDFYAGAKMIPVGATGLEQVSTPDRGAGAKSRREVFADFNAVMCGDGRSVDSGYAFVVAENGLGAKILRKGKVVAQSENFQFFTRGHNRWASIRCEKHGSRVCLFVESQLIAQYDDPEPLPGGYAGVWTRNNAIMIPRVTFFFERASDEVLSLL